MRFPKWFEVASPFKIRTEITIADDGAVSAVATATAIYDPIGILPNDIATRKSSATVKCHPSDEYNRSYGVRLAGNRAQLKLYTYAANRINEKLEQLDTYLCILHEKILKLNGEHENLLIEQMDIKEPPKED